MRSVYVVTEGGKTAGLGHIVRQFALCQLLKIEKKVIVYIKTDWSKKNISKINLFFKNFHFISDFDVAFNEIPSDSLVFMDGYNFDVKKINEIKKNKKLKLVFVADVQKKIPDCEVLINHLPWIKDTDYSKAAILNKLFGPKYAILRKPFYSHKKIKNKNRTLICLGGSDTEKLIEKIYNNLVTSGFPADKIDILYNKPIKNIPKTNLHFNLNAEEVFKLISKSNLCFITPGNISYEVFSIGKATVMGSISENQKPVAQQFHKKGLSFNVGAWSTANFRNLHAWIEKAQSTQTIQKNYFSSLDKNNLPNALISILK